jgi:replicative DNA helicase
MRVPQDKISEKHLLGLILSHPNIYSELIVKGLTVDYFHHPDHVLMFSTIAGMENDDKPIDISSVAAMLPNLSVKVLEYYENAPISVNPDFFLAKLKHKLTGRKVLAAITDIKDRIDADDIVDIFSSKVESLMLDSSLSIPRSLSDIMPELLDKIESDIAAAQLGHHVGIPTPFSKLNEIMQFKPGELIIIGARTGMGKTALAVNIALCAAKTKHNTAMFSLEMPATQMLQRIISVESRVSGELLSTGHVPEYAQDKFFSSAKSLVDLPISIDDEPGQTFEKIKSKIKIMNRKKKLDLAIVDYITLMRSAKKHNSVREKIMDITISLKHLAIELDIPIIVLAQVNRGTENRPDKMPKLSDLKESDSIAADADKVLFVYRESYADYENDKKELADDEAIIILSKNRHGRTCKLKVGFELASGRFFDKN